MVPVVKNLPAVQRGDRGLTPGWGRSPGEGKSTPLQCSCLGNPMDRGAMAGYSPWGYKESDTTERLTLSLSKSWRFVQNFKNLKHPKYRDKNQANKVCGPSPSGSRSRHGRPGCYRQGGQRGFAPRSANLETEAQSCPVIF